MKKITLTQEKVTLVDDDRFEYLNQFKWYAYFDGYNWYAARTDCLTKRTIRLHRLIMGLKYGDDKQTDHINGNGLDNRRDNLRICTRSQNNANRKPCNKTSKYLGVCKKCSNVGNKKTFYWCAQITKDNRVYRLGNFKTERAAALAYDKEAKKLHGDFARLNFRE